MSLDAGARFGGPVDRAWAFAPGADFAARLDAPARDEFPLDALLARTWRRFSLTLGAAVERGDHSAAFLPGGPDAAARTLLARTIWTPRLQEAYARRAFADLTDRWKESAGDAARELDLVTGLRRGLREESRALVEDLRARTRDDADPDGGEGAPGTDAAVGAADPASETPDGWDRAWSGLQRRLLGRARVNVGVRASALWRGRPGAVLEPEIRWPVWGGYRVVFEPLDQRLAHQWRWYGDGVVLHAALEQMPGAPLDRVLLGAAWSPTARMQLGAAASWDARTGARVVASFFQTW